MVDGALLSARDLRYLVSFLVLCIPVCLICYWLLIPCLSLTAGRLASVMLAAQILVIVASLFIQPATTFEERLWNINREFNIPSIAALDADRGRCRGRAFGRLLRKRAPTLVSPLSAVHWRNFRVGGDRRVLHLEKLHYGIPLDSIRSFARRDHGSGNA